MKLSRDSTIDTLLIVAGLIIASNGLLALPGAMGQMALDIRQSGLSLDLLKNVSFSFGPVALRLLAGAMAVFRPELLRFLFLRFCPGSSAFFESQSTEFYVRCVQVVGYLVFVEAGAGLLLDAEPTLLYDQEKSLLWFIVGSAAPGLPAVLSIFAPRGVFAMCRLESTEPTAGGKQDLGDLAFRRSAILAGAGPIFVYAFLNSITALGYWLDLADDLFRPYALASLLTSLVVASIALAFFAARSRVAAWFGERVECVCSSCEFRSADFREFCVECDSSTCGFTDLVDSPGSVWNRNCLGLLGISVAALYLQDSVRFFYSWYLEYVDEVNVWVGGSLSSRILIEGAPLAIAGGCCVLFFFRSLFAALLPRARSYVDILFRVAGILLVLNSTLRVLFLAGYSLHDELNWVIPWRSFIATSVLHLAAGLFLLYLPARWIHGSLPGGTGSRDVRQDVPA